MKVGYLALGGEREVRCDEPRGAGELAFAAYDRAIRCFAPYGSEGAQFPFNTVQRIG